LLACATARPAANAVDDLYRSGGAAPAGSAVDAYRRLIQPVLGSACPWLPSDSEFLVRSARNCGIVPATYAAFAGILAEPDLTGPSTVVGSRVRFPRGELRCSR
jgi:hypothetical protein